mmetsp:Transcript_53362/g.88610  ORF Transcript_53362/g.88610 Transcript_53362/m.88610 type:complete len:161 (+) Transcript_53362:31-513(+)|eukprot:CAMPEP_0119304112 /NCGR_PEP_ID=MMETSP1333-20130426/5419_1 /TAXON_ID=418940 /ORGANISM="Scyphosphaera apsteinii, Strain RCC1455" /LENGTH=160 /DNA_ID=CAMNT_0007306933 /DNA_START=28 /DNA_END=510 /DNA_ORIENTATION=-
MGPINQNNIDESKPYASCHNLRVLMEAVQNDADYARIAQTQPISRKNPSGRRPNFTLDFKIRLVREALQMPSNSRIKPTCARYPGVEPCQLRKWVRLYQTNVWPCHQAVGSIAPSPPMGASLVQQSEIKKPLSMRRHSTQAAKLSCAPAGAEDKSMCMVG